MICSFQCLSILPTGFVIKRTIYVCGEARITLGFESGMKSFSLSVSSIKCSVCHLNEADIFTVIQASSELMSHNINCLFGVRNISLIHSREIMHLIASACFSIRRSGFAKATKGGIPITEHLQPAFNSLKAEERANC